jgi:uncharacterized protein (TIGR04562 family)
VNTKKQDTLKKYQFNWEILDVIISGASAIDAARSLNVNTVEDVEKFLECYGYNLDDPIQKAELFGIFQEAVQFIKQYFLKPQNPDGLEIEIPRKILELTDISQLFLMASDSSLSQKENQFLALWACSVIKVMHTIAHMDKDLGAYYFSEVQKQILDKFYKHIFNDEEGSVYLGQGRKDLDKIKLVLFESKPKKTRESVILKLLHKPENVAEDIFDRVGIRFVTYNKFDALRVIKYLKDKYIVMPANIKPSRSRNTLIDLKKFSLGLNTLKQQFLEGALSEEDLESRVIALCEASQPERKNIENPHSLENFRSIQFTGRQLIKIKNPHYEEIKQLKNFSKNLNSDSEIYQILERIDLKNIPRETRFFYHFEVQIFDEDSYKESLEGRASHAQYKKNQIQTAMMRVMGNLISAIQKGKNAKD